MKVKNLLIVLGVFVVLITGFVSAFGVSSSYWGGSEPYPLIMAPGTSKNVEFVLQNLVGEEEEDVVMRVELVSGFDIASLSDRNLDYVVPFGSSDVVVNLEVTIQDDAPLGSEYEISVSFKQIADAEKGKILQLTTAYEKSFPVIVAEVEIEEEIIEAKVSGWVWITLIVGVVIVLIGYLLVRRKRQQRVGV